MRSALVPALAFAAALAACTVHVEGAACRVPGTTGDCPAGQACGTGSTCSLAAAACAPCAAGALECRSGSIDVMTCSAAGDPACGSWMVATRCLAGQQACQVPTVGDPACVYLEGASCSVTGATTGCPPGQACGTGLTCSVAAASCAPCVAGAKTCQSGSTDVKTCSAAVDPACGTWVVAAGDACAAGQACRNLPISGTPACVCDAWTVVPGGSAAACTRPSITSAIAEAVKFPAPIVHLGGASSATYGNEPDDSAPIIIPAGVTLVGDEATPAAATNRIIAVQGPGPEGLRVHPGAVVRGVAVQRGATAANELTIGVLLTGGPAASGNTLVAVRIDALGAGGGFAIGLRVAGGNAVAGANTIAVSDVLVRGATVAGLEVNRLGAGDVVIVTGSVFDSNHVGVSLLRGDLALTGTVIGHSTTEGIGANSGSGSSLSIQGGQVYRNGTIGVVLEANNLVQLEGVRICGNVGVSLTVLGTQRTVGGVYTLGAPPPIQSFKGNLIHDNGGDQLLFGAAATGTWNLAAMSCAIGNSNVVAGYAGATGVGISAIGASVDARNAAWKTVSPPTSAAFDFFTASLGTVNARGAGSEFCAPVSTGICPLP